MRKAKQLAKAILELRQAENDLALAKERLEDMGEDVARAYSEALIKAAWYTPETIAEHAPKTKQFAVLKYANQERAVKNHIWAVHDAIESIRRISE